MDKLRFGQMPVGCKGTDNMGPAVVLVGEGNMGKMVSVNKFVGDKSTDDGEFVAAFLAGEIARSFELEG